MTPKFCIAFLRQTVVFLKRPKNTQAGYSAFTLAELLVAVLIISIILTALAPVITKRVVDNIKVNAITKSGKLFLFDKTDPNCKAVAGKNSLDCTFETDADTRNVGVIVVSGGGGGAGATNPTMLYNQKLSTTNGTKEIKITKNMTNVRINYLSGSGAGGGGGAYSQDGSSGPQSQADCDPYYAKFIPASMNGIGGKNLCVTKYNVGDIGGPSAATSKGVQVVSGGVSCGHRKCCWKGSCTTANYDTCARTVCKFQAADLSCANWAPGNTKAGDWRLPTHEEAGNWALYMDEINNFLGINGLNLCDGYSKTHGMPVCVGPAGECPGDNINHTCFSFHYWVKTDSQPGDFYTYRGTIGGVRDMSGNAYNFAARCVLEGGAAKYSSFGGGGGGGGAYVKSYTIPQEIIKSAVGGKITLYAAAGGSSGAAASDKNQAASSGGAGKESYIYVYNSANKLIWGYKTPGGLAGGGAKADGYGTGGAQRAVNSCQEYNGSAWKSVSCSGYGPNGEDGQAVTNSSTPASGNGGNGGGSAYEYSSYTGGGAGGNSATHDGYQGSRWGAGGGGGTVRFVVSAGNSTIYKGKGGKGANGIAEIYYDIIYEAAAGGGGGGGAFARVESVSVSPSTKYTIRVGGGGKGGSVANNGADGGESVVTFGSNKISASGGGGGKIGTSATASTSVVQGKGGTLGQVLSAISDTKENGRAGTDATTQSDGSWGGVGGNSGIDTTGGCGGLFKNTSVCTNTNVQGQSVLFSAPINIFDTAEYGSAGAGGGGGAWGNDLTIHPNPGGGGDGQNGYVYIFWVNYK